MNSGRDSGANFAHDALCLHRMRPYQIRFAEGEKGAD